MFKMKDILVIVVLFAVALTANAQTLTDIDSPQYYGKTGIPKAYAAIDANMAALESGGSINMNPSNLTVSGTTTLSEGEIISQPADGTVRTSYDDDATTLGTQETRTTINATNISDNDKFVSKTIAPDSASNDTAIVQIEDVFTDATTATEDSRRDIKVMSGGSLVTALDMGSTAGGVKTINGGAGFDASFASVTGANGVTATAGGVTATAGGMTITAGGWNIAPIAITPTNAEAITVAEGFYLATPFGQTNGFTNIVTLANPTTAGDIVTFMVHSDATNLFGLADSGNLKLNGAFNGDADDTITLRAPTTSIWVEDYRSGN